MHGRDLASAVCLAIVAAACSPQAPSASGGRSGSARPSDLIPPSAGATSSPDAADATAKPVPTEVAAESFWSQHPAEPLLIGTAVRITVSELNIRADPSTSAKRVDTFKSGQVIVVNGLPPVDADGYTWYMGTGPFGKSGELPPLPNPAEAGNPKAGWFASRKGAVAYVEPALSRCADVIDLENLGAMTGAERLDCYGGVNLEFEGTYGCPGCNPEIFGDYAPNWLASPNDIELVSTVGSNLGGPGLNMRIPPSIDGRPEIGAIIRVIGHFDDPRASECTIGMVPWNSTEMVLDIVPTSVARLWCRQQFVVESYEVTGTDSSYKPF